MKPTRSRTDKGFSLIELIIVIAIMAVLTAILAPQLLRYVERARIQAVTTECRNLVVAARVTAIDSYSDGSPVTTESAMTAAFLNEIRSTAQTPTEGVINHIIFEDFELSELSYTNRGITVLYKYGTYTVLGRGVVPTGPSTTLTKLTPTMTPAERELAIRDNAKALMAMSEVAIKNALSDSGAAYMSKGSYKLITEVQRSIVYYDSNRNQISGQYDIKLEDYLKPLIEEQGMTVGSSTVYFEKVSDSPPLYSTTPDKIVFKSNDLTGGTNSYSEYTYDIKTGSLTVSATKP